MFHHSAQGLGKSTGKASSTSRRLSRPSLFQYKMSLKEQFVLPLLQVHPRHRPPPGPVVIAVVAPHVQLMPNTARAQNRGKPLVLLPAHVPLASREHGTHVVVPPAVAAVRQVVGRIIEVHILAVPAIEEALDVEGTTHRH